MDFLDTWIVNLLVQYVGKWGLLGGLIVVILSILNAMKPKDREELLGLFDWRKETSLFRIFVKGWERIKAAWEQRKQTGLLSEEFWTNLGLVVTGAIFDGWKSGVHTVFVLIPLYYTARDAWRTRKVVNGKK
jgi:hypothetical protein